MLTRGKGACLPHIQDSPYESVASPRDLHPAKQWWTIPLLLPLPSPADPEEINELVEEVGRIHRIE
jgi:hypothetical protein